MTAAFGSPHLHFHECDSTNTRGRELAAAAAPHGTVITATAQTTGRGRQGRLWSAPAGKALLYSALMRDLGPRHALLPLAVPLAVCETVETLRRDARDPLDAGECQVKWPNDVWISGRKCAGILIEARPQDGWAVIGVGLNVAIERGEFPKELRESATSVGAGTVAQAQRFLDGALTQWVEADEEEILAAYRKRDGLRGRQISWAKGVGTADGIDERGNLIVATESGETAHLGAGEVHLAVAPPQSSSS